MQHEDKATAPRVSVVIPAYNAQDFIGRAVRSIVAQSYPDWELILVDDGSTDQTWRELNRLKNEFSTSDINLVRQENRGVGGALNSGLEQARGEYVVFLGADDYLAEECLEKALSLIQAKQLDVLLFGAEVIAEESSLQDRAAEYQDYYRRPCRELVVKTGPEVLTEQLLKISFIASQALQMVRRQAISDLRFVEKIIYEDNLFTISLLLKKKSDGHPLEVGMIPDRLYIRTIRADSIMNDQTPNYNLKIASYLTVLEFLKNTIAQHLDNDQLVEGLSRLARIFIRNIAVAMATVERGEASFDPEDLDESLQTILQSYVRPADYFYQQSQELEAEVEKLQQQRSELAQKLTALESSKMFRLRQKLINLRLRIGKMKGKY